MFADSISQVVLVIFLEFGKTKGKPKLSRNYSQRVL